MIQRLPAFTERLNYQENKVLTMNSFKNKLIFVRTSSQKSKGYETTETIPPRIVRHIDCLHDRLL